MYRKDRILGGWKRGKWDRIIQGWKGLWDRKNVGSRMGCWLGGPHMGYFDIILADGVKLC